MSATQIGDVNGVNGVIGETLAQFLRLLAPCFGQFRVTLAIDQGKRIIFRCRPRFAVPDQQYFGSTCWPDKFCLPLGFRLTHTINLLGNRGQTTIYQNSGLSPISLFPISRLPNYRPGPVDDSV